jgi:hypothetical protein
MPSPQIWKYHLKGGRKGESEILMNAPGIVDNLKPNGKGGYLVAVAVPIGPNFDPMADLLGKLPAVQRFSARLVYAVGEFVRDAAIYQFLS